MLVRIAESFDIPRELTGLSWWGTGGTYGGDDTVAQPPMRESEDVRRRTLAATTAAAFGQVVSGLGELTELALPTTDQPGKAKPATLRADDRRISTLTAWLSLNSATAYALMDHPEQAKRCLGEAHEGWTPRDAFERAGTDRATAEVQLDLRRFDIAESFAASAVRAYDEGRRGRARPRRGAHAGRGAPRAGAGPAGH